MITAPFLYQSIDITLPKGKGRILEVDERDTVLRVKKDGVIIFNDRELSINEISGLIPARGSVFIKADEGVSYGRIIEILLMLQSSNVENIGLIVSPEITSKE